jgi:ABC-type transport system involved in multi-copper enzyme maturation permease subunit
MFSPVCSWTLRQASRREWHYWLRTAYFGWLLLLTLLVYLFTRAGSRDTLFLDLRQPDRLRDVSVSFVEAFLAQQFFLLLTVVPALGAGSITEEKTRGTLQYLLSSALTPAEIILQKWLAQLLVVGELALVGLPLLCLFGNLAGMDGRALLSVALSTLFVLAGTLAASLLASVWCRKTTTAVLNVYLIGGLFFVGASLTFFGHAFHPFHLIESAWNRPDTRWGQRLLEVVTAWGTVTIGCLALASWRLRPAYVRQSSAEESRRRIWRWLERPAVGNIPLRWKERYAGELATLVWLRWLPRRGRLGLVVVATVILSGSILLAHLLLAVGPAELARLVLTFDVVGLAAIVLSRAAGDAFLLQGVLVALLAGALVAIRSAGAVSGERERQSWELLLVTPLQTKQIVRGKLWGIIDAARPYLRLYLVTALIFASLGGFLALFWIVFWWLAAWVIMYFMGATAIDCSARHNNSWRSLLATLTSSAWGVFVRYLIMGLLLGGISGIFLALLVARWSFDWAKFLVIVLSSAVTGVLLFAEAEFLLERAEQHLAAADRIPQKPPQWSGRQERMGQLKE